MSRHYTARRFTLLGSTSFVAANILAGAGALMATAFAPSVALATCNPDASGTANPASVTETCAGADTDITYTGLTHKFDVILDGSNVSTNGVAIDSANGSPLGITNVLNASTINSAGVGVQLVTTGALKIDFSDTAAPVTITAGQAGIFASGGTGTIDILLGAGTKVSGSPGFFAVSAVSNTGGNINVSNNGAIGGTSAAMYLGGNGGTAGAITYKGTGTVDGTGGSVAARFTQAASVDAVFGGTVKNSITSDTISGLVKVKTDGTVTAGGTAIQLLSSGGIDLTTTKTVSTTGFATAVALSDNSATGIKYAVNADVSGGFSGITATEGGTGAINVTVATGKTVTGNGFEGINATNTNKTTAATSVIVTLQGNASVNSTNGNGVTATTNSSGSGSVAKVDFGSGTVNTTGSNVIGLGAFANPGTNGGSGNTATVTTGTGATINVGTAGGSGDIGVAAWAKDAINGPTATIALGTNNVINVGGAGGTNNTGLLVKDNGTGVFLNVSAGSGLNMTVNGDAGTGISAVESNKTFGFAVNVTLNGGTINVNDAFKDGDSVGILATNAGTGGVTVDTGTTTINVTDGNGIVTNTGQGGVNKVTINGAVNAKNGDGIDATSAFGQVNVTIGATGVIGGDAFDGVEAAITAGKGAAAINVVNDGAIGSGVNSVDQDGLDLSIVGTGNIKVTGKGSIDADQRGIVAVNNGSGTTTIDITGKVTGNTGAGIDVANNGGTISVKTGAGAISGATGILATNTANNPTGAISISVGGDVTGTNGHGVFGDTTGTGTVSVTANGPGTITGLGGGSGIFARNQSATGSVVVDLSGAKVNVTGTNFGINGQAFGDGNVDVVSSGTVKGVNGGILAQSGGAGAVTVNGIGDVIATGAGANGITASSKFGDVSVGNLGGGYDGAIDPQGGGHGIQATVNDATGIGNVSVTTTTKGTISGNADIGILASTPGLGSVTVVQNGEIGDQGTFNFTNGDGIQASIKNAANTKDVNVTENAGILSGGNGVKATTSGLGSVKVDQTSGFNNASFDGINATITNAKNVGGNVTVNTSAGSKILVNKNGILATTVGEGDVFVTNAGNTVGGVAPGFDGIFAGVLGPGLPSSDGSVTVNNQVGGTAAGLGGTGIKAQTNSNDDVKVTNAGTVLGATFGVDAINSGVGGAVTVTQTGGTTTQTGADTGAGISATITDLGNSDLVFVDVQGGKVDAQGNGVFAQTKGTGNVKVDNAGTINGGLSGTAGDGIQANALGGGNVLVNNTGTVTGDPGIKASAIGFGTVTVVTSGVVSAVKDGIETTTVDGTNTVTVSGAGTVTSTTEDGIDAKTTGIGLIDINTAAGTTITTTGGKNGILATQTGTGDIDIDAFGAITAGTNGINAKTTAGTIDILTGSGKIQAGGGGSGIIASSTGAFNVTITTGSGDVAGSLPGFGILGTSGGGNVQVNVGSGGSSEGGVDAITINAGTATVNVGGDVVDTGFEGVRASTKTGLAQVTLQAGKSVSGNSVGVLIDTTSGPIIFTGLGGSAVNSAAGDGINAKSTLAGGTILITHAGSITSAQDGVDANTADATINVTVDGAVTAGGKGLSGIAGGANAVNITNNGTVKATGGEGLNLASAGGTVTATANGTVEGTTAGIKTRTSGAGKTNVDANNTVTATAGIGIDALTTSTGLIDIDTVAVNGTAGGIQATSAGGNITVDNAGAVNGDTDGNKAGTGIKATTSGAGIITVTLGGTVSGGVGIDIATTGSGTLNVVDGGFAVTGTGGDGIKASGGTGNVNIGTGPGSRVIGPISGADDGIDAKGAGNVNVFVQGDVTGDTDADGVGDGIHAESSGAGFAVIVDSTGGAIKAGDDGIEAKGLGAGTTVTVTNTDSINAAVQTGIIVETTDGAVSVDNKGDIDTLAFGKGGENGIVAHSTTGQITIKNTGNIGAAGAGNGVDNDGIVAQMTTGSANTVTVTNSGNIWVDSTGNFGIFAQNPGTGDVTVTNDGVIDPPAIGIFASGGGNVTINNSKNVTAISEGIWGVASGPAGKNLKINLTGGGAILATAGASDGVLAQATAGANITIDAKTAGTITGGVGIRSSAVGVGTTTIDTVALVTGATGDGVKASTTGSGAIKVTTGAVGAGDDGIDASSTGGASITVVTNGVVTGADNGIITSTTAAGVTDITANGNVTGTAGDGINAVGAAGSVTVTTSGIADVLGGVDGIDVTTTGGNITVTANDTVKGGARGIATTTSGTATTTITAASTVNGVTGDGIQANTTGTGKITILAQSTVDGGDEGVEATSTGGNIDVTTKGVVTGADNGILTATTLTGTQTINATALVKGTAGDGVNVNTTGSGTIVVNTVAVSGAVDGIDARSAGGSSITVTNAGTTTGTAGWGVRANTAAGAGVVTVNVGGTTTGGAGGVLATSDTGAVNVNDTGSFAITGNVAAGSDGIRATSNSGAVNVGSGAGNRITGAVAGLDDGIEATSGGNVQVWTGANVTGDTDTTGVGDGIRATSTGAATSVVVDSTGGAIKAGDDGIEAQGQGAGTTVSVNNTDSINALDTGIFAQSVGGSVTVNNTGAIDAATPTGDNGIWAQSSTGAIKVDNTGAIGAAGAGNGVDGYGIVGWINGGGTNTITVNNSGAIWVDTGGQAGIWAGTSGTGDVTVNNSGVIDPPAFGIFATGGGNVTVNTSANVFGGVGIHADSFGVAGKTAKVTVTGGAAVAGLTTNGIEVLTTAGANATVDISAAGNLSGATNGISTSVTGAGTTGVTTINTLASKTTASAKQVTGFAGDGIVATTTGSGLIDIDTNNVTGSGLLTSSGINASSTGGSSITVDTYGVAQGDVTGSAGVTGGAGIQATTKGGGGSVTVTLSGTTAAFGVAQGGNYGINASSTGAGTTTVNVGTVAGLLISQALGTGGAGVNGGAGPVAIQAFGGTGGVNVTVGIGGASLAQAANGRAIVTQSDGNASITLGAGASARGLGDAAHAVIDITNTSGAGRTTLTNAGLIQSMNATPLAYGDLAITGKNTSGAGVAAGGTTINNTGGINGRLVFSGLNGANTLVFNNNAGGVWHTTGASTFGPGADTITNAGQIFTNNAGSATSIDFGTGADTFTNTGALVAGEAQVAASASNLVLTGLETFTNNGQISFGGSVGASDNAINDKINAAGALFGGTGKLFMDADLWSISQATCAALTAADCLAVGTTTGLNSIVVNDINTHAVGAFNPNGIALVTGSTNAGANFKLDPASEWYNAAKFGGVLDKPGLFFYDLAWSAANGGTTLLIGVPDTEAFELSELGNAAQSIWYSSTGTWFDRQADLRQSLAGRSEGWAPSVWLKVVGDWTQRDNITSFSIFNKVYAFDVGYNQDTVGLIGGIDFLNVRDGDEAYVFGGQVGYMDSDVRFNSPTRSNFSGMVVGLYGTYMNGGFFLDGIANANFLDLHHYVPTLPGPPAPGSANADVTSFGGQVEAGYQMAIGATGFWEPLASLAYVHTEIDALSLGGNGSVDFPSTVSFRGSLGARVGMSGDFQYYKVRVALTGRLWDEFDGDNSIVVISPGPSNFATNDDFGGTFGEVTLGGNLFTTGGNLSAFANVGVKFRSDYQSTNVSVGFRYQW